MKSIIIAFAVFSFLFQSCQKEDSPAYQDKPVVESYLSNNDTLYVKVSRQVPFSAENAVYSSDDINNLDIHAKYNDTDFHLTPMGKGVYKALSPLLLVKEGSSYSLKFFFNKDTVSASTTIPTKPENFKQSVTSISISQMTGSPGGTLPTFPDPVKLTWNNPDNTYYLVVIQNIATNPEAINDFGDKGPPSRTFRTKPSQSNISEIEAMQFNYYGMHRLILYHLNPDYASLYDESGTSSQNLTSPITAVKNGLGIFTGTNSDTLLLNVKKP